MRRWLLLGVLQSALAVAVAAEPVPWSALAPSEQELLAPWETRWPALNSEHQQRLRDNARAWLQLTPEEREQFKARIGAWEAMPPGERARLRERYEAFLLLPPEERQRLRRGFQRFRDLPPEQRRRLRQEFERMSPAERRAFLLGAQARDTADTARRAFAFVPPEERPATLQMLRELSREDRQRLRDLVPRLAPEQRDALRRDLLQRDPAQRSA
jgi:hypothetical protein